MLTAPNYCNLFILPYYVVATFIIMMKASCNLSVHAWSVINMVQSVMPHTIPWYMGLSSPIANISTALANGSHTTCCSDVTSTRPNDTWQVLYGSQIHCKPVVSTMKVP